MQLSGYTLMNKTSLDKEAFVLCGLDYGILRHEVASGAAIISTSSWRVLLDNVASSDLTLSAMAIDVTNKKTQVRVTDSGTAQIGKVYAVVNDVTLSDSTQLCEGFGVQIVLLGP